MSDKRQSTTSGAWVSPQPVTIETRETTTPTHKGEISQWRTGVFFVLAFAVALCGAWLAFTWSGVTVALSVFVLALLFVFVPLYAWDSMLSSGFMHRRSELSVEMAKIDLATLEAARINEAQQEQLNEIYDTLAQHDERIKAVETIRVTDQDGTRHVAKHDNVDIRIAAWLHQTMFDANGMLCGAHPAGHLKAAYPFKGDDEEAQTAHRRLLKAGLVGKTGNNYTWTGPNTLSATKRQLQG
mgnify:CR=1 FL=1